MDSYACVRCSAWGIPLRQIGALMFCDGCVPPVAPCPPFGHQWRGGDDRGQWGCTQCGAVLSSQAWRELQVVEAPPYYDDC